MTQTILDAQVIDGVLQLQLRAPEVRNALSAEMKQALHAQARRFVDDDSLRCLLITGCDAVFCAGGDLRTMQSDRSTVGVRRRMALTHASIRLLAECEKPIVTAINGAAVGAGLSLALMGDVVVAAEDAYFMAGFANVGVLPDMGLLYHLPRTVGRVQASDLLLSNRRVPAPEALALGLVSRVLPQAGFLEQALELARGIAAGPGVSFGLARALMAGSYKDSFSEFLLKESLAQAVVFGTDDFAEGVSAFGAKRKPRFTGR
ncbi:MAG: enoyl-CoA hydratase/isomerase family protein [Ottowia sp.]|nr:MAG: enoyl-CoA hydratase/isomerase family protein [Ottowia sp.]HQD13891.1 enoyl-CoA hydratase-related protein [Ottowia sp.]